jgi:hypothetical protein
MVTQRITTCVLHYRARTNAVCLFMENTLVESNAAADGASKLHSQAGRPPQSLVRAWLAMARRPAPEQFALVSRNMPRRWIIASLALEVAVELTVLALNTLNHSLSHGLFSDHVHPTLTISTSTAHLVFAFTTYPFVDLACVLAAAVVLALVMPKAQGSAIRSFGIVLRPWALAQVPRGPAEILIGLIVAVIIVAGHLKPPTRSTVIGAMRWIQ